MRLVILFLIAALGTGCISGLDQKPYSISFGPSVSSPDNPDDHLALVVAGLLAGAIAASVYMIAETRR